MQYIGINFVCIFCLYIGVDSIYTVRVFCVYISVRICVLCIYLGISVGVFIRNLLCN